MSFLKQFWQYHSPSVGRHEITGEYDDSEISRDAAYADLKRWVISKLEAELSASAQREVEGTKAVDEVKTPLTREALDQLPWQPFKSGKGEWIFANAKGPVVEALLSRLDQGGGKADLEGYHYKFSASDQKFINRFPVK